MFNDTVSQTVDETVAIRRCSDVVTACQKGQALARQFGLSGDNQVNVILTILNAVHRISTGTGYGQVVLSPFWQDNKYGIVVKMNDKTTWKIWQKSETHFATLLENQKVSSARPKKTPAIVLEVLPFEHIE